MIIMGIHIIETGGCYRCKCPIYLPVELYKAALASQSINFYCPYGHQQHFIEGETEETKLRRERDRLKQQIAQRDDEIKEKDERIAARDRSLTVTRGHITRIKNRVGAGVCPCCTRNFSNLKQHMENKHPGYRKDDSHAKQNEKAT